MPFAKMCVNYTIGDPLPYFINAVDFDPLTGRKINVEVKVTYLNKPLICSSCKSLGHLVPACPKVSRIWVQKFPLAGKTHSPDDCKEDIAPAANNFVAHHSDTPVKTNVNIANDQGSKPTERSTDGGDWTEVSYKRKPASSSVGSPQMDSPPLPSTFLNLRNVDEIEKKHGKKLSKSDRKRAKRALGSSPLQS